MLHDTSLNDLDTHSTASNVIKLSTIVFNPLRC